MADWVYDLAGFDRFRMDLIRAGFAPERAPYEFEPGSLRLWSGPIAEPLRTLTTAERMQISFRDGWPFQPPEVIVPDAGIESEHFQRGRDVLCLWQEGDNSGAWFTFAGVQQRIAEWVERHQRGFEAQDAMLDAHRYFRGAGAGLATLDLDALRPGDLDGDQTWMLHGKYNEAGTVLELSPEEAPGAISGRGYYHEHELAAPPHDLASFKEALTVKQRNNFERRLRSVRNDGKPRLALLLWRTAHGRNALVLMLSRVGEREVAAAAIEFAPSDEATLRLRCGPDAELLDGKRVIVFGAGAIGSHVAVSLAAAGLRRLVLVDRDTFRPSNAVRHQGLLATGDPKVGATAFAAAVRAPWVQVERVIENPWSPRRLSELMADCDLVIDATGSARFTAGVGRVAAARPAPLVSAALYRGGAVARVRRQAPGRDTPIHERADRARYLLIPPDPDPPSPRLEAGCGDAVNNASPIAVARVAGLATDVGLDLLGARFAYDEEIIEVYRPLPEPGFDAIGRVAGA